MATLHASTLLHAVTRMVGEGTRYPFILFDRQSSWNVMHLPPPPPARTLPGRYPLIDRQTCMECACILHPRPRARMLLGRYSLILFYRQICPHAGHALVQCSATTMDLLYPLSSGSYSCAWISLDLHLTSLFACNHLPARCAGSYSCDLCGDSASELGGCDMWHCAQGCEYDVCSPCHSVGLADGVEYVSVH